MSQYRHGTLGLIHGDCRQVLKKLPDGTFHSVVTDPPYELRFMGKAWDSSGVAYDVSLWREILRVLKPGGHLACFGGARTYHRVAVAIEDAGFELRESIDWIFSSGFPKGNNISKSIDKMLGVEREPDAYTGPNDLNQVFGKNMGGGVTMVRGRAGSVEGEIWDGWNTQLKPAHEPIILGRKPLAEKTVAANVLKHSAGGLNIDSCRVGTAGGPSGATKGPSLGVYGDGLNGGAGIPVEGLGRFPTDIVFSHSPECSELETCEKGCPVSYLDEQPGTLGTNGVGASRFFPTFRYQAKAPPKERPKVDGIVHTTVKPLELIRWLVRLITPTNGLVLDPFEGSGTTGQACDLEGFRHLGIEQSADYVKLIEKRWGASW